MIKTVPQPIVSVLEVILGQHGNGFGEIIYEWIYLAREVSHTRTDNDLRYGGGIQCVNMAFY